MSETAFRPHGEEMLRTLIADAKKTGRHSATATGDWEIGDTVLLPSDFTLFLDDCHLRMADGTFCQMFRNEHAAESGVRAEDVDRGIALVGRGRAILDGGNYNGLSERNYGKNGMPSIFQNNLLLFCNVDGFRVENLHLRNQRWWALNFLYCRNGLLRDLDFLADCTRINERGERVPGLLRADYEPTYVKNADGIDLRVGCHDILIENITGFTEDDTIALTALKESVYRVEGLPTDLHNVIIRNVRASSYCALVRLLNQGGTKLYNILIDGVMDASADCPCLDRGENAVRVGDVHLYGSRHATKDETRAIVVRNVWGRGANAVLALAGQMSDCRFENIFSIAEDTPAIRDDSEQF